MGMENTPDGYLETWILEDTIRIHEYGYEKGKQEYKSGNLRTKTEGSGMR